MRQEGASERLAGEVRLAWWTNAVRVGAKYRPGSVRVGRHGRCLELKFKEKWGVFGGASFFVSHSNTVWHVEKSAKLRNDQFIWNLCRTFYCISIVRPPEI